MIRALGLIPSRTDTVVLGVAAVADPLLAVEGADMLDETELDSLVRLPDRLVGELLDLRPGSFLGLLLEEVLAEVLRVELLPLCRGPCRQVDAVGDVADVQLFWEEALPDGGEHLLRYTTVQQAHTVGFLTGIQCEDAHGELLVALGILTTEADEVVPRDAETPRGCGRGTCRGAPRRSSRDLLVLECERYKVMKHVQAP